MNQDALARVKAFLDRTACVEGHFTLRFGTTGITIADLREVVELATKPPQLNPQDKPILDGMLDHTYGCRAPDYGPCSCAFGEGERAWISGKPLCLNPYRQIPFGDESERAWKMGWKAQHWSVYLNRPAEEKV